MLDQFLTLVGHFDILDFREDKALAKGALDFAWDIRLALEKGQSYKVYISQPGAIKTLDSLKKDWESYQSKL